MTPDSLNGREVAVLQRIEDELAALFGRHGKDVRVCRAIDWNGARTISFRSFPTSEEPDGHEVAALPADKFINWPAGKVIAHIERRFPIISEVKLAQVDGDHLEHGEKIEQFTSQVVVGKPRPAV
jgi:hypothetical protein